jgi:membrane associated rhomboid family serine protease
MSHNVIQRPTIGARRHIRRVVTVVTAVAATGLGWAAGRLAHVDYVLQTPLGARQITLAVMVIAATAISGLVGWAVSRPLERHASDVVRAWITLAVVVLMLSILPIFAVRASVDTRLALTALHCLAAAILTAGLPQPR